jgi:uncharacterized protein YecA (UPF0149 family)
MLRWVDDGLRETGGTRNAHTHARARAHTHTHAHAHAHARTHTPMRRVHSHCADLFPPTAQSNIKPLGQLLVPGAKGARAKAPKPNEPCPCGSGKKYKKCCKI